MIRPVAGMGRLHGTAELAFSFLRFDISKFMRLSFQFSMGWVLGVFILLQCLISGTIAAERHQESTPNLYKVSNGDFSELSKAFEKLARSDGHVAESLDIAIGKSIINNPGNFLRAYKRHKAKVMRLGALVGNLGTDYVDDFSAQAVELRKRIAALESVKELELRSAAKECIQQLQEQLKIVSGGNR